MSYNADSIKSIDPIAHIRLRPGMYLPDVGIQGLHHLLEEVLNNSVDEFMAGHGKEINIVVLNGTVSILDHGRGIPFNKIIDVFTKTLTGGKFDSGSYNTSSGLNGIGLKAVNALSSSLSVTVYKGDDCTYQEFKQGKATKGNEFKQSPIVIEHGTAVSFTPDPSIFEILVFDVELLKSRLFYLAGILPGLKITLDIDGDKSEYYETKALDAIQLKIISKDTIYEYRSDSPFLNLRINYCRDSSSSINSFVNTVHTYDNGSHVDSIYEIFATALRKITGRTFSRNQISQGLRLTISVFFEFPVFRGQHKGKLADNRIFKAIYDGIYTEIFKSLQANKDFVNYMVLLITEQERLLQELDIKAAINTVKNASKENKLPVKLAIAHNCTPETRELFLVEGDSAGGTVKMARGKNFQEVLPLRGKVINAFKSQYSDLLGNREVIDIFLAIGGMESTNTPLRCKNVFIMADSDPDGAHINALLLSMFAVVYPSFVKNHNLYVVEPPLFSLVSDDIRMYGHETKDLIKRFKAKYKNRHFDIYRNKGLGELNASELEEFINPKTRSIKKMKLSDISIDELVKLMGDFSDIRKSMLEGLSDE